MDLVLKAIAQLTCSFFAGIAIGYALGYLVEVIKCWISWHQYKKKMLDSFKYQGIQIYGEGRILNK